MRKSRTAKSCRLCGKAIPYGTVSAKTTTKQPNGEYLDEYVCWRCGDPYRSRH